TDDTPRASLLRSLATAGSLVLVGSGLAYGERRLSDIVGAALSNVLPWSERFWNLTADVATLGGFVTAVGAFYRRVIHKLEVGATAVDPIFTQISVRDVIGPTISGSEPSLVSWDSLGREGRRHGLAYVRPEPVEPRPAGVPDLSIETVMGEPARATPVQVYVGLDSAPSMSERVELALAEIDRTGAWERSLIMLVSPTGTGYVNYCAVAAVQYLSRGDVAAVTLQYSKRPSPLSLGKVRGAREQNRLLWLQILGRLRGLPPDRRPRVVLFGESLGAHTSQDVLLHWGTLGPQALGIDRALWIGTPYASRWMQQVTGPARFDVDSDLVTVVNDFGQLEAMPQERRRKLRYVLLSHDNDGVTKFGADLIAAPPRWLTDNRPVIEDMPDVSPRGIPASMRWRPLVTFVQLLVDMKNAQLPGVYRAYAHDYRPDLARFVREVFDLPCSDEQLARIEDALEAREALRAQLFSDGLSQDDVPETTEPAGRSAAPEVAR
ncbi:MAG: alpha/beta-hydrolase family protein, partial [Actinomycetes bacterium]